MTTTIEPAPTTRGARALAARSIMRSEAKILASDPNAPILLLVLPLVLIALTHRVFESGVGDERFRVLAGPAYALMFAFLINVWIVYSFFKEHGWGTWPRIRASGTPIGVIIVAKLTPYVVLGIVQVTVVLTVSLLFLDDSFSLGELVLLVVATMPFVVSAVAFGFFLAAFSTKHMQATSIGNFVAFLGATLGGTVIPKELLPGWAVHLSPATPHYWAMKSARTILFDGSSSTVVASSLMLLAAAAVLLALGGWRFSETDTKQFGY